jgi:predicted ATPase/DNA-binding SARP family transcriptional activator
VTHDPAVWLQVLGPTRLERDGAPEPIPSDRQRRILTVLAAAGGRSVSVDTLIDAVWGDRLPANPYGALQTQLSRLRQLLGTPARSAVRRDPAGYALILRRYEVDAWRFEDVVAPGQAAKRSASVLAEALSLWQGDAFADVAGHPAVRPAADHLEELRRAAIEELADAHLRAGAANAAIAAIEPLLVGDPYRERARAIELRALYHAGRPAEALARYAEHRRRLAEELGVDPSPLLRQVGQDILRHRLPAWPASMDPPGERLPPLPISSFVGREHELAAACDLLGWARIVTITGPGGVGKTRLALHVAHQAASWYPDEAWCDLASATPGEVATVVASRLGVQERSGQDQRERLAGFLADRRVLLVLDNCEHVVAAAAGLVDALVRRGRALGVLATSRQPLGVDGEHQLRLGPLALPADDRSSSAAVDLFVDRARAADPGFRPHGDARPAIIETCRRVGGLPLAIELAAACTARIDLRTLADRVADQPGLLDRPTAGSSDRHRSLEGVLESSYRLLGPDEGALLDRLSVFAGPFTLDDAEALDGQRPAGGAGRTLGGLVDKSMVTFRASEGRYELLPPVQALGRNHLAARGERELWRSRHVAVVLDGARRIDRALRTAEEQQFRAAFDDAVAELRAAHGWLLEADDMARQIELCACLHWFAMLRDRSEFTRWADAAIERAGDVAGGPAADQARACAAIGAAKRGDLPGARTIAGASGHHEDGRRFSEEIVGQVNLYEGRLEEAIACSRAAARLHDQAGDDLFAVNAATVEAVALAYAGHPDDAESLARRLVRRADRIGAPSIRAMTRFILGETISDHAAATAIYQESISLAAAVGAGFVTGVASTSLASRELRNGQSQRARRRLARVIGYWQRAGVRTQQWLAVRLLIEALDHDGEHDAVATLAGAYAASAHAAPALGDDASRLDDAIDRARSRLGAERYAAAQAAGAGLTDDQAAALAAAHARASAVS